MEEIRSGAIQRFQKRLQERLSESAARIEPRASAAGSGSGLLADRSDISEELIRLKTHAAELEQLVRAGGEIGKKLDFLSTRNESRSQYHSFQDRGTWRFGADHYGTGTGRKIGDRQDPRAIAQSGVER